ncbi:MAG: patatin-like phospholipase family protein [Kiritimatiellae bacterium]|nr:patatin-like phospholipase family protein [Kiritimatiellia bacterium]
MRRRLSTFLVSLCLVARMVGAAEEKERPKIGLALSGGGALGCAHIGVLKVLEELRVPVDCVAGTSMGSIVAGFYAAGLSPDEIERIFTTIDWHDAFVDQTPRQQLIFRRKEEDKRYPLGLEIGWHGGHLCGPSGLLAGQKLGLILREAILHVPYEMDFDELSIPYRAVATDLRTGEPVVIGKGDLMTAMRASMAIPAVFSPITIDGRLLVDGGVVNNLPTDVVRDLGVDVLIAVNVRAPPSRKKEFASVLDVTQQAAEIAVGQTDRAQRDLADILIEPDLSGAGMGDYRRAALIIERGVEAARAAEEQLRTLSAPAGEYEEYLRRQRAAPPAPARLDFVTVEGNEDVDTRRIMAHMRTRPGDVMEPGRVRRDVGRVFGLGEFERIGCALRETNGVRGLALQVTEKSWGPSYLHVGMKVRDDFEGNSSYSLLVNHTRTRINPLGAEWRTDLKLGETRGVFSEFYQPLCFPGTFFIAPGVEFEETDQDLYEEDRRIAEYNVETAAAGLDLGAQIGEYGEVRVGLRRGWAKADADVGQTALPSYDIDFGAVIGRVVIDRLDNVYFPRSGSLTAISLLSSQEGLGSDAAYEKLEADWGKFASRRRHTFFAQASGGSALGSDIPEYDEFAIGGQFSLSGYAEGQLRGSYFAVGSLGYYYRLAQLSPGMGSGIYLGLRADAGNAWTEQEDAGFDDLRYGGTVFVGADTILGPLYLGYGQAEHDIQRFYFSIGETF